jgi:hypothetical protein
MTNVNIIFNPNKRRVKSIKGWNAIGKKVGFAVLASLFGNR